LSLRLKTFKNIDRVAGSYGRSFQFMMTTLPNKHFGGRCKSTQEENDQRTPGKEIWRKSLGDKDNKCFRQLRDDAIYTASGNAVYCTS